MALNSPFACTKDNKLTTNVLFIVAMLQIPIGGLYGWFYCGHSEFGWQEWMFVFSPLIYFLLGWAVRWISFYSLLLGCVLYFYFTQTIHALPYSSYGVWQNGLILKLPVLIFLLWGLLVENNWQQSGKKLPGLLTPVLIVFYYFTTLISINAVIILHHKLGCAGDALAGIYSYSTKAVSSGMLSDYFKTAGVSLVRSAVAGGIAGLSIFGLCSLLIKLVRRKP